MTNQEIILLKEVRKETEASYSSIVKAIKQCGLDKEAVIDYLGENGIAYA